MGSKQSRPTTATHKAVPMDHGKIASSYDSQDIDPVLAAITPEEPSPIEALLDDFTDNLERFFHDLSSEEDRDDFTAHIIDRIREKFLARYPWLHDQLVNDVVKHNEYVVNENVRLQKYIASLQERFHARMEEIEDLRQQVGKQQDEIHDKSKQLCQLAIDRNHFMTEHLDISAEFDKFKASSFEKQVSNDKLIESLQHEVDTVTEKINHLMGYEHEAEKLRASWLISPTKERRLTPDEEAPISQRQGSRRLGQLRAASTPFEDVNMDDAGPSTGRGDAEASPSTAAWSFKSLNKPSPKFHAAAPSAGRGDAEASPSTTAWSFTYLNKPSPKVDAAAHSTGRGDAEAASSTAVWPWPSKSPNKPSLKVDAAVRSDLNGLFHNDQSIAKTMMQDAIATPKLQDAIAKPMGQDTIVRHKGQDAFHTENENIIGTASTSTTKTISQNFGSSLSTPIKPSADDHVPSRLPNYSPWPESSYDVPSSVSAKSITSAAKKTPYYTDRTFNKIAKSPVPELPRRKSAFDHEDSESESDVDVDSVGDDGSEVVCTGSRPLSRMRIKGRKVMAEYKPLFHGKIDEDYEESEVVSESDEDTLRG